MQATISKRRINGLFLFFGPAFILSLFFLICSFSVQKFGDDFLKQLGITQQNADQKISNSILGGYIDSYGTKNAKNIALGNRKAVTLDLLAYIKKYVSSAAFVKEYSEMRERYKPVEETLQTPEQMRADNIAVYKKSVAQTEENLKKADPSVKQIFEKALEDAKKALKDAEDPNNKYYVNYTKNYPQFERNFKESHDRSIADWNAKYPKDQLQFVKKRLQEFLNTTNGIDFSAELTEKNGKKVFVNPDYERKDGRWKMAFRAGRGVVEPARDFVQKWIDEIK
ncbi:MAG TPA: hypothetical protein VNT20_21645 [Flavisolibacter sp.]|nr:hypothetical protein [Flavisolibacter sp.]